MPSPKQPRSEFHWPPTEDELQQYANNVARSDLAVDEASLRSALERANVVAAGTAPVVEGRQPPVIQEYSASAIADLPAVSAFDGTATGGWAAEIARLQGLIDGLTGKVERR